jgi:hypothetical protein
VQRESTLHSLLFPFYCNKSLQETVYSVTRHFLDYVNCSRRQFATHNTLSPKPMTLDETLTLLRSKENESGRLLENALWLKRHRQNSNLEIFQGSSVFYLPAVNSKARIKWGGVFIQQLFDFFGIADDDHGPIEPIFLVTLADKSHLTTAQPQPINLTAIKRKLGSALNGLSYIGMIEPGYYNVIYDKLGVPQKNLVSWHGHLLVWGISQKKLLRWKRKVEHRLIRAVPHLSAVHIKRNPADQFGQRIWYINKSPRTEYSIGKRGKPDRNGLPRYKQNSRKLRPGHRVQLFYLMHDMHLPELAMAGGEGRKLLAGIKYDALRDYRRKY